MSAINTFIIRPGNLHVWSTMAEFCKGQANKNGCIVQVGPIVKKRTNDQNAALFGVAYPPLMEFMGLRGESDRQQLHTELCCQYFGEIETKIGFRKPKRTTTINERGEKAILTTAEFADFYAFVQQQGAEIGCYVPDPDPMKSRRAIGDFSHD